MRLPLLGEIERENQWNERKERGAQPGLDAGMVELTVERILVRRRGDPVPRRTRLGNDGVGHGSTWARRARSRSGMHARHGATRRSTAAHQRRGREAFDRAGATNAEDSAGV